MARHGVWAKAGWVDTAQRQSQQQLQPSIQPATTAWPVATNSAIDKDNDLVLHSLSAGTQQHEQDQMSQPSMSRCQSVSSTYRPKGPRSCIIVAIFVALITVVIYAIIVVPGTQSVDKKYEHAHPGLTISHAKAHHGCAEAGHQPGLQVARDCRTRCRDG
eukprot:2962279-Karenia_brevis.AAC.1